MAVRLQLKLAVKVVAVAALAVTRLWYNEQLEIVGGDGNTIEQKRLVMLWN